MTSTAALQAGRWVSHQPDPLAIGHQRTAHRSEVVAEPAQGLRHSGLITTRLEVAERIRAQLVFKRQLRERWLREHANALQAGANVTAGSEVSTAQVMSTDHRAIVHSDLATAASPTVTSYFVHQLVAGYYQLFLRRGLQFNVAAGPSGHLGRSSSISAQNMLSVIYGLEGDDLDAAVTQFIAGMRQPNDSGGDGGNAFSDQGHAGGGGAEAPAANETDQPVGDELSHSAPASSSATDVAQSMRSYLLAEIALQNRSLSPTERQSISDFKSDLFAKLPDSLQAMGGLGQLVIDYVEQQARLPGSSAASNVRESIVRSNSLHDVCAGLLRLYSPDTLMKAIGSLMQSVDVLGRRRAFHGDGVALSDCLGRVRNLGIIRLIMDKTTQLKNRMLFTLHTGKLPADEAIWRAVCKTTQGRSIEPMLSMLQEGDLSPASKRLFLQGMQSVLRDLPQSVWPDGETQGLVLAMLAEFGNGLGNMRRAGKSP